MVGEDEQKKLERRRPQAGRWLLKGFSKAEVARRAVVVQRRSQDRSAPA